MEEAAAASLDRAKMIALEQELGNLRESLAFEEALRQQVCLPSTAAHAHTLHIVSLSRALVSGGTH